MPTLAASNIPTPKSWDEFEDIALSAAKLRWSSANFYRHGRPGQRQDGVDIFGTPDDSRQRGLQGKNTIGGIDEATILKEVAAAESFQPALEELYIVTTAKRDAPLQKAVRKLSAQRKEAGKFTVAILFWDDIVQDLTTDPAVFRKHYPELGGPDHVREHDKALADELGQLLSSKGVIGFLDQNNMAGFAFHYDRFEPLRTFVYDWNKPEKEFLSPELEEAKMALWRKADAYFHLLATETFPTNNPDFHTVPPEWEYQQPERFWKVVKQFHALAGEIVDLHAAFTRTAKKVLIGAARK
jgi:hypothetical protein